MKTPMSEMLMFTWTMCFAISNYTDILGYGSAITSGGIIILHLIIVSISKDVDKNDRQK